MSMTNPYEAPSSINEDVVSESARQPISLFLFLAWPVLLALNLVVPLLFGWSMIRSDGKIGVAIAVAAFAIPGWLACIYRPQFAKRMLTGATVVALSQFFPLLQMIAGMIAFSIAVRIGQAEQGGDFGIDRISTEFGGFLVTLMTGGMLFVCSLAIGYGMFVVFNPRSNSS